MKVHNHVRMKIHQNFSSSMIPSWKKRPEARGYAQISDYYVYMWYICYWYCITGHSLGALIYLKTKTQHLSSFLQLLQKVQVSG